MIQSVAQQLLVGGRSRFLALLAVVLLATTPLLEASHDHDTGAAYAECLLCKQSTDLPVVSAPGIPAVSYGHAAADTPVFAPALAPVFANYSPRGPPAVS